MSGTRIPKPIYLVPEYPKQTHPFRLAFAELTEAEKRKITKVVCGHVEAWGMNEEQNFNVPLRGHLWRFVCQFEISTGGLPLVHVAKNPRQGKRRNLMRVYFGEPVFLPPTSPYLPLPDHA